MTGFAEVVGMIEELSDEDLKIWIKNDWVKPDQTDEAIRFSHIDIARIRLIAECRFQLEIEMESMSVILSLLDQVYGLRSELQTLVNAVNEQPLDVRNSILRAATDEENSNKR